MVKSQTMIDYRNHIINLINKKIKVLEDEWWENLMNKKTISGVELEYHQKNIDILKSLQTDIITDKAYYGIFNQEEEE